MVDVSRFMDAQLTGSIFSLVAAMFCYADKSAWLDNAVALHHVDM